MNVEEVHALFDHCRSLANDVTAADWETLKASIEQERPSTTAAIAQETPQ